MVRPRQERGAAAVEFALVAPVLLLIVFGIIAFGVVFAQELALGNAARQASRYGVIDERTCDQISTEARSASATIGLDTSDVVITIKRGQSVGTAVDACQLGANEPCAGSTEGDNVYVTTAYTSHLVIPLPGLTVVNLAGEGVFRCEFS